MTDVLTRIMTVAVLLFSLNGFCARIDVTTANIVGDGSTDNSSALQTLVNNSSAGDVLYFPAGDYLFSTQVNIDKNISLVGESKQAVTLIKQSNVGGMIIGFAQASDAVVGGLSNLTFKGGNSTCGNGGASFGTSVRTASKFQVRNCDFKNFSQYGLAINNAENFFISDIRILDHGDTANSHASCMGFYIYPKVVKKGAKISNIYSEISANCVCNTAAIKLQIMENLVADSIYVKGGTEECIVIDSLKDSRISNVTIQAVTESPGISIRTYNPVIDVTGGNIVLDGITTIGTFSRSFVISSGDTDYVSCDNVKIMNVVTDKISAANLGVLQNSVFSNIVCSQFRLDEYQLNTNYAFENNQFININVTTGAFTVTGNANVFENIRSVNAGNIAVTGDNNSLENIYSENCNSNGITLYGDNNTLVKSHIKNPANRPVWVRGGDSNLIAFSVYKSTYAILDNGTNSNIANNYNY